MTGQLDGDGVRVIASPGVRRVVLLLAVTAVVVAIATLLAVALIRRGPAPVVRAPSEKRSVPAAPGAQASAEAPSAVPPSPSAQPRRLRATRKAAAREEAAAPRPEVSAKDVIPALVEAGERGGIAAFSPPGTKPVKSGVVVPDDFELPEGYVRHHQTTDDGEQLPPILMFHPDYQFVDESGAVVALPPDRVVPPDMAPPGLPIRMLEVPAPPP